MELRAVLTLLSLFPFLNCGHYALGGVELQSSSIPVPHQIDVLSESVFDLTFEADKRLGLQLGAGLEVIGFQKQNDEPGQAEQLGVIRHGDKLVGLNGRSLSKLSVDGVAQLLQNSSQLVLRFQIQATQSVQERLRLMSLSLANNTGRLEVLVSNTWEQIPVLADASFASPRSSCDVFEITKAQPIELCHVGNGNTTTLLELNNGKILVTRRGGCSFHAKAAAASRMGAKGVIIVNTEDKVFHMEADELFGSTLITIPVAMVSRSKGEELLRMLEGRRQPVAKFVISERCLNFDESHATSQQVQRSPNLETLRENDLAKGGYLRLAGDERIDFITAPFGGSLDLNTHYAISFLPLSMNDKACLLTPTEVAPLLQSRELLPELVLLVQASSCSCLLFHVELPELEEMTTTSLPSHVTIPVLVISSRGYDTLSQLLLQRASVKMHMEADSTVLANWKELEELEKKTTSIGLLDKQKLSRITSRLKRRYSHSRCQTQFVNNLISKVKFNV